MVRHVLGEHFEREIREQPVAWRTIAESSKARALAEAIRGRDVLLLGSGSSLFMAQLGALALRKRGIRALALASTEAPFDHAAYRGWAVVACSQSGRSEDLLVALDVLRPQRLVALTNTQASPLAERASVVVDVGAGRELAVPASKSVTCTAALLLWAATLLGDEGERNPSTLEDVASEVAAWLDSPGVGVARAAAREIARRSSVVIVGTGYGLAVAHEFALKMKEASYIHAEGFSAGEFRHGSAAILDGSRAVVGVVDDASRDVVRKPLLAAAQTQSLRYVVGGALDDIPLVGPVARGPFAVLAWLVAGQVIALEAGRARNVESDAPRGQAKVLDS